MADFLSNAASGYDLSHLPEGTPWGDQEFDDVLWNLRYYLQGWPGSVIQVYSVSSR